MSEKIKIVSLELENVKRVKTVSINLEGSALTIIGGDNAQGKTSILDGICYLLGGERQRPSNLKRDDSMNNPYLKVVLSNGLVAERKGKNSSLRVMDPKGLLAGQALLDSFIGEFSINLPKFMNSNDKEKAKSLLKIIGIGEQLRTLEEEEGRLYNERLVAGRISDQKKKFALELPAYDDVPEVPITASELISQQQAVLAKNGQNGEFKKSIQLRQAEVLLLKEKEANIVESITFNEKQIDAINQKILELRSDRITVENEILDIQTGIQRDSMTAEELVDESTEDIETKLTEIDAINQKVRANLDKEKANEDSAEHMRIYDKMSVEIEAIRDKRMDLLNSADFPIEGLSVENGELTYNGKKWDCMSGSERIIVAIAITQKLKPECGFVLLDKLEQLDNKTLAWLDGYLESEGIQVIATRVSKGEECSIIIEDGKVEESDPIQAPKAPENTFGDF